MQALYLSVKKKHKHFEDVSLSALFPLQAAKRADKSFLGWNKFFTLHVHNIFIPVYQQDT